ncbi:MAG: helix-turn-helix domain-containing protein [Bacteriovoracales bacterium]|nr:helix-turn-helix domain-containing protein [Bacteriovoracales bacterium]
MKSKKEKTLKAYIKSKTKNEEFRLAYEEVKMHFKIAHLIEELRIKSDMTQAQLAKKSSVSQPMIARLEKGDQDRVPTLSTINKVFKALGYEVEIGVKKAA